MVGQSRVGWGALGICGSRRRGQADASGAGSHQIGDLFLVASFVLSAAVALLVAATLVQSRGEAWAGAERASENLAQAVIGDVGRNLALYRFVLRQTAAGVSDPDGAVPMRLISQFLAQATVNADHLGSLFVLDAEGRITADSMSEPPPDASLADQDYFTVQRDRRNAGLYVSRPFASRARDGDPRVALSLRIEGPTGAFRGVAVATVRLAYFGDLFSRLDVGRSGSIAIIRNDGVVLMREPSTDGRGDVGVDIAASRAFQYLRAAPAGSFVAPSPFDGVERLYSHAAVPDFPFTVIVAASVAEVLSDWWRRASAIAILTGVICLGGIVSAALTRREMIRRGRVEAQLALLSRTDSLTGLANRREFEEVFAAEWWRAARERTCLALLMIDADRFKQLNDRFGHARGDECLQALAQVIAASCRRPGDLAARIGGEEFAVLLPATTSEGAQVIAERIRAAVEAGAALPEAQSAVGTTVSVGVAATVPGVDHERAALFAAADRALYRAKEAGRNRVATLELAPPEA